MNFFQSIRKIKILTSISDFQMTEHPAGSHEPPIKMAKTESTNKIDVFPMSSSNPIAQQSTSDDFKNSIDDESMDQDQNIEIMIQSNYREAISQYHQTVQEIQNNLLSSLFNFKAANKISSKKLCLPLEVQLGVMDYFPTKNNNIPSRRMSVCRSAMDWN